MSFKTVYQIRTKYVDATSRRFESTIAGAMTYRMTVRDGRACYTFTEPPSRGVIECANKCFGLGWSMTPAEEADVGYRITDPTARAE